MPTWLGIDIGGSSVKAALVRSAYRKLALVRVASVEIVAGGGAVAAAREAAVRVLEGEAQNADAVATAVDGSRAAIHRLLMPGTAQKQLADVLAYELGAQVPFDLEAAVFDWRLLEPKAPGQRHESGQLSIVAAVARIDDVRARIAAVKEAVGHEPERVAVGALALGALVPFVPSLAEGESVAIVDLGAKASEVLILEQGEAIFARTLSIGTDGLPASAPRLARDIRVSFAAHRAQGGTAPSTVYLCGGGAYVSGAEGFLAGELEIPVQRLPDPSLDLTALAGGAHELPRYAKALALALAFSGRGAGLNLRRGPLAFERGFTWVRERIPILAGLAAVVLVSFVFSGWARIYEAHTERDALQGALGAVTKDVLGTEATSAQEAQDLLAKEAALSDEDPMPHADGFDTMVRLSEAVPPSIKHDIEELDLQKGHVVVRGVAGSIPDSQAVASALADFPCMSDVKIKSTTQAVGSDRQKYVMEFDVKCPEDVKAVPKKKSDGSAGAGANSAAGGSGGK